MFDNTDFGYLSSPCYRPEKMDGSTAFPALYQIVLPYIEVACNETAMVGVVAPSRNLVRCIVARMCNRIFRQYPELMKYDVRYSNEELADLGSNHTVLLNGYDVTDEYDENGELVHNGPFRDYLSTLFLLQYYGSIVYL